jgi:hypothetical protein
LHHTGSQGVTPVAVPEEPEEQPEVQEQEVPEARALSKEASPEAFLSRFAIILLMLYFN